MTAAVCTAGRSFPRHVHRTPRGSFRAAGHPSSPSSVGAMPVALTEPQQKRRAGMCLPRAALGDQGTRGDLCDLTRRGVFTIARFETMYRDPRSQRRPRTPPAVARIALKSKAARDLLAVSVPNEGWVVGHHPKLLGRRSGATSIVYVILDIFSRRVVGWCVADAESATCFQPAFEMRQKSRTCAWSLTLARRSRRTDEAKATAFLLADLGVTRSHNGPHHGRTNQPVIGKPLQNIEISAALPATLRLHRGRQKLLPAVLRLV